MSPPAPSGIYFSKKPKETCDLGAYLLNRPQAKGCGARAQILWGFCGAFYGAFYAPFYASFNIPFNALYDAPLYG